MFYRISNTLHSSIMTLQGKRGISRIVKELSEDFCNNSSCHGGNWISEIPWQKIRLPLQIIFFACQSYLVYILYMLLIDSKPWYNKVSAVSKGNLHEFEENESLIYPKIAICSPSPFDKIKLNGNIS